jgi:hypothetical protein
MKIPLSDIETFTYHQAVSSNNVGQSAVVSNTNTSGAIPVPNYEITSYDVRCINDAGKELKKYSRHFYTGIILYSTGASVLIIGAVVFTPLAITAGTVAMFAGVILALESPIHVNKAGNLLLLFQPKIAKK